MKYALEIHLKKHCLKSAQVSSIEADHPFPFYPPGTIMEWHGADYEVIETLVVFKAEKREEETVRILTHKVVVKPI